MAIFHLKYSCLNWRAIPCRRRMICVYAIFHHFLNIFFRLSWFSFRLNSKFSSAWHDNQFFFCSFFLFHSHDLSTLGNDARHTWPFRLKHLFSYEDCFERWPFGPRLFISFLSKERIVAQKCFREMGNFGPHAPKHQANMTSRCHGLGTLFCSYSLLFFLCGELDISWNF